MSNMERNKGKLIPTGMDTEHFTSEDWDYIQEEGFVVIDGEVYSVEYEVKHCELYEFAEVEEYVDGTISFHAYHYNGSGHWSEVVEDALNRERSAC